MSESVTGAIPNIITGATLSVWAFDIGDIIAAAGVVLAFIFYIVNWQINKARLHLDKNSVVRDYVDRLEDPDLRAALLDDIARRGDVDRRKRAR